MFRQRAIGYLFVLPAEWIQAVLRPSNCPPKPNIIQETTGHQASTHYRTGKKTKQLPILAYLKMAKVSLVPHRHDFPHLFIYLFFTGSGISE